MRGISVLQSVLKFTAIAVVCGFSLCFHAKADSAFYDQFFNRFVKTAMAGQPFDYSGMTELGESAGPFKGSFLADDESLMAVVDPRPDAKIVSSSASLYANGSKYRKFGKMDGFDTLLVFRSEVDDIIQSFNKWLNETPGVIERSKCTGTPEKTQDKNRVFWAIGTFKTPDGTPAIFSLAITDLSVENDQPPSATGSRFVFLTVGVGESARCAPAP